MIIYLHGLNSGIDSNKFKILQKTFGGIECFEWVPNDPIKDKLNDLVSKLSKQDEIVLIGDSTGANFAYQARELLKQYNKKVKLILISPLLSMVQMNKDFFLYEYVTDSLRTNVIDINYINDALVIKPINDEVLSNPYEYILDCKVVNTESGHRIDNFEEYVSLIENYLL